MAYKAHWDSQKKYDEFWNKGKKNKDKKNKKKKFGKFFLIISLALIICAALTAFFAWRDPTRRNDSGIVVYEQNEASKSIVDSNPVSIPDYSGKDVLELDGNVPGFTQYDFENITGENYSNLDRLGRCGTAVAMIDRTMMPTGERGSIGQIKPTGWVQNKYPGIVDSNPPYLYNRCHLIAYALTGQNANELNLITGTRYMNATTMLPYEEQVMRYLDYSDNHVLYRISPYFKDSELIARGIEMEAYSVEDNGAGICFHVFVYNVQPGIEIDYRTGDNKAE